MRNMLLASAALMALTLTSNVYAEDQTLTICTGGEGGFYEGLGTEIGKAISKKSGIQVEVVNTGGSVENAELMKDGDCQMAIMQADAAATLPLPADIKVTDAHRELVYWLHPKEGPIDDFGVMENDSNAKRYAVAVVAGSGSQLTVRNFEKTDKDYAGIRYVEFDDVYSAAESVSQGFVQKAGVRIEVAGMLYISRPGIIPADITEDFGKPIVIGEINDDSFAASKDVNGNQLYTPCAVNAKQTGGLSTSTFGEPDSYCLRAQVVYNNEFHAALPKKEARELRRAVDKGINGVVKAVR